MNNARLILESDRIQLRMDDYARLRELTDADILNEELDRAIVVPDERLSTDVITMNARVVYTDSIIGEQREVELVYPHEADATLGKISVLAPVGMALIGLETGQSIDWTFPDGKIHRLSVLSVSHPYASAVAPATIAAEKTCLTAQN